MSIFPTRILLATDGSRNVAPAADVAVQLSKVTGSELHLVYVGEDAYSATLIYPETTDPGGVERETPYSWSSYSGNLSRCLVGYSRRKWRRCERREGRSPRHT